MQKNPQQTWNFVNFPLLIIYTKYEVIRITNVDVMSIFGGCIFGGRIFGGHPVSQFFYNEHHKRLSQRWKDLEIREKAVLPYVSLHLIGVFDGGENDVQVLRYQVLLGRLAHDDTKALVQEVLKREHC